MSNETNHQSSIISRQSSILRSAGVAVVIAAVLLIGHYGLRSVGRRHFAGGVRETLGPGRGVPLPPTAAELGRIPGDGGLTARYAVSLEPADLAAFFREEMPRRGWREIRSPRNVAPEGMIQVLTYSNSAREVCTIGISEAAHGGSNLNIIMLSGAPRSR